jgi:quinol monooxygenase YgiN
MIRTMIIATLKIFPYNENLKEVVDILLSVKGPVMAESGCLGCCLYEERGEEQGILFIEQWRSMKEVQRHLNSSSYSKILEVMELSSQPPEVSFYEIGETWGLELVERMRSSIPVDQF